MAWIKLKKKFYTHFFVRDVYFKRGNNLFIQIWDIFFFLVLISNLFFIPSNLSFFIFITNENNLEFIEIIEFSYFLIFLCDIFIFLERNIYLRGTISYKKSIVFKNYLENWFLIDFLTLLPFFLRFNPNLKLLEILSLFRILKFREISLRINENWINFLKKNKHILRLLKLLFTIFFVAHLFGCLYHFISAYRVNQGYGNTWLTIHKIENESKFTKYINAVYFMILTMSTIGYIQTESNFEKIIGIFVSLILAGTFAYSINTIGLILEEMHKDQSNLKY